MTALVQHIRLELSRLIRWRWLIALVLIAFSGYIGIGDIFAAEFNSDLESNLLDYLFVLFNNLFYVMLGFGLVFIYLISDLTLEDSFGQYLLMRLKNRRLWWWSKFITTGIAALLYTLLHVGGLFLIGSTVFQWDTQWSALARGVPEVLSVREAMLQQSPLLLLGLTVGLLFLFAWGLGLVAGVLTRLRHSAMAGFIAGAVIIFSSIGVNNFGLSDTLPRVFMHQHTVLSQFYGDNPLWVNGLYWLVIISSMMGIGHYISSRQDFLR